MVFEIILSAISASLLLVLSAYVFTKQRTAAGLALFFSSFFIASIEILDQVSLHLSYDPLTIKKAGTFIEALLPAILLFFSLIYARQNSSKSISISWKVLLGAALLFPVSVFVFPADAFFYSPDFQIEKVLFLGKAGYWFYIGIMAYLVLALMNFEATLSATTGAERWKMKFEVIGISSIVSVLVFYYSQGLLYRAINMNLLPIRSGVLIIAVLLIGYSKLVRGNNVRVSVSRYIVYRSFTLLLVGLYLVILGVIGEGMRYLEVPFSSGLTIFIAFASGIAMAVVLFSEQLRRKVKVYFSKHFFANKHDYRTEWLNFTHRLTSCTTIVDVQAAILATYQGTFGLKGVSLYLLDKDKKKYVMALSREMPGGAIEVSLSSGLISYFVDRDRIFNPLDGEYTVTPEESHFVLQTRTRLIVPLIVNRSVEGLVVLGEAIAQDEYIYEDYDLMKAFAKQAVQSIFNFNLSEELAEAREVATVARISTFIMHDLKNLVSAMSLIAENAKDHMENPEFQDDMLQSIRNMVKKMKGLIARLNHLEEKAFLHRELVDLKKIVHDSIGLVAAGEISVSGSSALSEVDIDEIQKVILNLILNSIEASNGKGPVMIEVGSGDMAYIRVKDKGSGMTKEFMNNHLFKPFRTTKRNGLGIGLYQCKQIMEAHGGFVEVESGVDEGTVFTLYFPMARESEFATP